MNLLEKSPDKVHHFVYSFAMCMAICCIFSFLKFAPLIGFIGALSIGIYKEVKDLKDPKSNAEFGDIIADVLGVTLAMSLFIFSRIF